MMAIDTRTAAGARGGFRAVTDELAGVEVEVSGTLPSWLRGSLIRVTPSLLEHGGRPVVRHWFDGLAMLHAFAFADGEVRYTSRFVDSAVYRKAREGEFGATGFGTDPCRTFGQRIASLFSATNDNPNVNVIRLGERFLALTEVPLPVEFDPQTLATKGGVPFTDKLGGAYTTAHPHHDRVRDEAINVVLHVGRKQVYRVTALQAGSTSRRLIAEIPVTRPGYQHSFALTERFVVLTEWPVFYNLKQVLLRDSSILETMRWDADAPTRIIVVDRTSGQVVREAEAPARFCFHHVNAFEADGEVVLDLVGYDDASVLWKLAPEALADPAAQLDVQGHLERYTVPLDGGPVRHERLSDASVEFGRINYRGFSGRDYRYGWFAEVSPGADWFDTIVKIDVAERTEERWSQPGAYPGEPVFVPAADATAEDDGVILTAVYEAATDSSALVVLDAGTLTELGRAHAPQRLPYNFHQDFFRS